MIDRTEVPILVVDDDEGLLTMIVNVLRHAGFKRISTASSGEEAIAALSIPDNPLPDSKTAVLDEAGIVVLDVMLPGKGGFEICKEIKTAHPNNMALMMSGFDIEGLNDKLVESEADDFLTKPFSSPELVARIEMLAGKMKRKDMRSGSGTATSASKSIPYGNRIPHIGDFIGQYMILDSLGWGKNSVIYKTIKKGSNEISAVKLLTKYSMEFKDVVKRFEEERKIMSKISHPNIIKFIETGVWDGCPFIVMECIKGSNLEERLVTNGPPEGELALTAAIQVASALAALHKMGVLHRDIKLKNIMFDPDSGVFKLTDFGIARFMDNTSGITCDGFIVGTPMYMAPEVFRGEAATIESDIYSYGATLYHFAAGSPAFSAKRNADMYKKHLSEIPKSIRSLNPGISSGLESVIMKCMAKPPEARPQSMDAVHEALEKVLAGRFSGGICRI